MPAVSRFDLVALHHEADGRVWRAVVDPAHGASVLGLSFQRPEWAWPQPVLERADIAAIAASPTSYGIPILAPTPGRVGRNQSGRFDYAGRSFRVEPTRHGYFRQREWTVAQRTPDSVVCTLGPEPRAPAPDDVFRFELRATCTLRLAADGLSARLAIESCGRDVQPVSAGFHPYFHCDRRAAPRVRIPARQRWALTADDEPTPTGELVAVAGPSDFRDGRELGRDEHWDDVFTALEAGADGDVAAWIDEVATLPLCGGGRQDVRLRRCLRLPARSTDAAFMPLSHVQLYTPKGRDAVALEPLASPPDALNLPRSERCELRDLRPGEKVAFEFGIGMDAAAQ